MIRELEFLKNLPLRPDRLIGRHKYPHYAVFVPFLTVDGETHWLLEKRSESIRQGGEICFPGGAVELENGEDPEEAARRETSEELGVPPEAVHIDGYLGHLITHWGGVIDVFYGTLCGGSLSQPLDLPAEQPMYHQDSSDVGSEPTSLSSPGLHPKPDEVKKVFTVPLSFFRTEEPEVYSFQQLIQPRFTDSKGIRHVLPWKRLGLSSRYARSIHLRTYPVYFYHYKGEMIWGITADIIREFLEVLYFSKDAVYFSNGGKQS